MRRMRFVEKKLVFLMILTLLLSAFQVKGYAQVDDDDTFRTETALGAVSGAVYGPGNVALEGARVVVLGTGKQAITDASGAYSISDVPAGNHTLTVNKVGFVEKSSEPFVVAANQTANVSVTLVVEELLKNGGFEAVNAGIAANWSPIKDGWGNFMQAVPEAVRSGNYGMSIFTSASNNPWVMQPIPVSEGGFYKVTSWFKAMNVTGNVGLKFEFYKGPQNTSENWVSGYDVKASAALNDGGWHELSEELEVPSGTKYMYVYLRLFGKGTAYFDDASVVQTKRPPQLVSVQTNNVYYYPDMTAGTIQVKTSPEDGITSNKTVDIKMVADETGVIVFEENGIAAALEMHVSFDPTVMDMQQPYRIVVTLREDALRTIGELERTVYRWARPTALPANGPLYVDGQPFFPVIGYHVDPADFPDLLAIGINTIQGRFASNAAQLKAQLDAAHASGLKMLVPLYTNMKVKENFEQNRQYVAMFKDHPAVLAWMIMDEPSLHKVPQWELLESYRQVRAIDPVHPTYITDYDAFETAGQATDILTTDVYPYRKDFMQPISAVGKSVRLARAAVDDAKPIWTVLQTFRLANTVYDYLPTIDQVRNMAYQSVLAGGKGLAYYSITDPGWKLQQSELWPGLVQFKSELGLIGELVTQGAKIDEHIGNDVQWGIWERGSERYAVAINLTKQNQTAALPIAVPGYEMQLLYGGTPKQWASWESEQQIALTAEQTLVYRIVPFAVKADEAFGQLEAAKGMTPHPDWAVKTDALAGLLAQLQQALQLGAANKQGVLQEAIAFLKALSQLVQWTEQQDDVVLGGEKAEMLNVLHQIDARIQSIVQAALRIDLQVASKQVAAGDALGVGVQIRNATDKTLQNVHVSVYVSLPGIAGMIPVHDDIGSLSASDSSASHLAFDIPEDAVPGDYQVTAVVQFQYEGETLAASAKSPIAVQALLKAVLDSDRLELQRTGTHSFALDLTNHSMQAIAVDLSFASSVAIAVYLPSVVLMGGKETKRVEGSLTVPHTVTEAVYQLDILAKVGDTVHASVPLHVHIDTNLVYNGGFEKQASSGVKADGWYTASAVWDRTVAHSGQASARIDPKPTNSWNVINTANEKSIPVVPGKQYVLSGWVKNESTSGAVELGIRQVKQDDTTLAYNWTKTKNNSGWTEYRLTFVAAEQTRKIQVYFKADTNVNGPAWLDDVNVHG
ncbi:carboxypeptidase regulatory-like domain-containing protein [Paenibacillus hodogayensis]|uniref:Carboxypeptidase regulatory-like domain-containing protein n=1 Tax=Paenibacillus hodogayensis TaxID=279208 RepID=A0ABV5VVD4_9BACL